MVGQIDGSRPGVIVPPTRCASAFVHVAVRTPVRVASVNRQVGVATAPFGWPRPPMNTTSTARSWYSLAVATRALRGIGCSRTVHRFGVQRAPTIASLPPGWRLRNAAAAAPR